MPGTSARRQMTPRDRRRSPPALLAFSCLLLIAHLALAAESVRIAVLDFGTASWELDTVRFHSLDKKQGIEIHPIRLAGKQATMVALQGGDADMALTDWLWTSRQRAKGKDFTFVPYSSAAGALVVPRNSGIRSLRDLSGKRIGIAGGPLDKNWLLFRALALQKGGPDPALAATLVFGAPPLLNKQLEQGRIDAVINFWPYVARLEAKGMRTLMSAQEATVKLGISTRLPMVGYVFHSGWARANPKVISGLITAVTEARTLLAKSDAEWKRLRPLMRAPDEATFKALRDGFRAGIPRPMDTEALADAGHLFALLANLGGEELAGPSAELSPGTFWDVATD